MVRPISSPLQPQLPEDKKSRSRDVLQRATVPLSEISRVAMEETLGKSSWITAAPADLSWREIETDGKTNMCTAMNQSHFNFSLWGIVPFFHSGANLWIYVPASFALFVICSSSAQRGETLYASVHNPLYCLA